MRVPRATSSGSVVRCARSLRAVYMAPRAFVAAYPDDENTQAITYLARGRGCRTAYLSLTRGDGGQNLLGP